jgi:ferredoxin--NADP+ reductase
MEHKPDPPVSLRLQSIKKEATNTYSYIFPKPDNFTWSEGACVHLGNSKFDMKKGKANKEFVRHLSIASLPDEKILRFTTRIPEDCSQFKKDLLKAKTGDLFTLFKPENRMELQRKGRPIVVISAGVGIATARPLIRAFTLSQKDISSLFHINIDSSGEFLYQEEIDRYACSTNDLTCVYARGRTDFYRELEIKFHPDTLYYIIGSDAFLTAVGRWLIDRGVMQQSVILDKDQSFYEELTQDKAA